MKKIFTLITTALLALGVQAATDLTLNVSETAGFGGWGFNNEAAPTVKIGNWSAGGGWTFAEALSQDDYCGVDFTLEATTEKHVTFKIVYAGGSEQNIDVPTGTTSIVADFAFSGNIEKIGFTYGDWEGGPDEATITITKALVKAESTGERVTLDVTANTGMGDDDYISVARYTGYSAWAIDPVINADDYEKVVITFAEPVPTDAIDINAESESDDWSGTKIGSAVKGATKATAYLSSKAGSNIKSIGFKYGWSSDAGDESKLKVAKAELVKKSGTATVIDLSARVEQPNGGIYTLSGTRVNKAGKGIYIVNGKKTIVKAAIK